MSQSIWGAERVGGARRSRQCAPYLRRMAPGRRLPPRASGKRAVSLRSAPRRGRQRSSKRSGWGRRGCPHRGTLAGGQARRAARLAPGAVHGQPPPSLRHPVGVPQQPLPPGPAGPPLHSFRGNLHRPHPGQRPPRGLMAQSGGARVVEGQLQNPAGAPGRWTAGQSAPPSGTGGRPGIPSPIAQRRRGGGPDRPRCKESTSASSPGAGGPAG